MTSINTQFHSTESLGTASAGHDVTSTWGGRKVRHLDSNRNGFMHGITKILGWSALLLQPTLTTAWCPDWVPPSDRDATTTSYSFTEFKSEPDPTGCGGLYRYQGTGGFSPVAAGSFAKASVNVSAQYLPSPPGPDGSSTELCDGCFDEPCNEIWTITVGKSSWCEESSDSENFKADVCGVARQVKWVKPDSSCLNEQETVGVALGGALGGFALFLGGLHFYVKLRDQLNQVHGGGFQPLPLAPLPPLLIDDLQESSECSDIGYGSDLDTEGEEPGQIV